MMRKGCGQILQRRQPASPHSFNGKDNNKNHTRHFGTTLLPCPNNLRRGYGAPISPCLSPFFATTPRTSPLTLPFSRTLLSRQRSVLLCLGKSICRRNECLRLFLFFWSIAVACLRRSHQRFQFGDIKLMPFASPLLA